ncbi:MAG: T9SS type A sorting domain-containing protein [Bacteroidetes bacterium]|nr:MAG: T9SS type A sorting domain-containing protein [Bacteroidota bacterium]
MNKCYLLLFMVHSILLPAQTVQWHHSYNPASPLNNYCQIRPEGDQYLVTADQVVVQLDARGTVTGYHVFDVPTFRWSAILKQYEPATGTPYFLVAGRRLSATDQNIRMRIFRPGTGFEGEIVLPDTLGLLGYPRPFVFEKAPGNFIIFGSRYYRSVQYDPATGLSEQWVLPLDFPPAEVVEYNGGYVLAGEQGQVQAIDPAGNVLWDFTYPLQAHALSASPSGILLAGKNTSGNAVVVKLNTNGTKQWYREYADRQYNGIIPTADGSFAATGLGPNDELVLVKLNANGTLAWSQSLSAAYSTGGGSALIEMPDGGFLVVGLGAQGLHCIRTDALGQAPESEPARIRHRQLKTGTQQADFFASPTLFFDGDNSTFITTDTQKAATLFAFSPWIAGLAPDNQIRLAASTYGPAYFGADYRTGTSATLAADFDRVWAVSLEEIQALRTDFLQDNDIDQQVPYDLLTWPGEGNPNLRYNLDFTPVQSQPDDFPAPFVDVNNDGKYNVYDGDYPQIKGDRAVWWVLTDDLVHTQTNTDPLGIDLQIMAYVYDCSANPVLDQSLFVDYEIINRSQTSYTDAYMGFFTDPDLGCYQDDYIGSAPQADAWYVYNKDEMDDDCSGIEGFGEQIPVQSVSFLNQSLDHFMYFINPSFGTPPPGITDPQLPGEFYYFLQSKWRDGTPLTGGGTGYNPFSLNLTNYAFSGNPADPQGWSNCTVVYPTYDQRMVASHGPFDLAPSDLFRLELAFTFHPDIPHPCPDIFNLVVPALEDLQNWHGDGIIGLTPALDPVYSLPAGNVLLLDATIPGGTYNWSTGSKDAALQVSAPGTYTVTITGAAGCTREAEVLVQQALPTKVPDRIDWNIRPNPASDLLYITCPDCKPESMQAVLYNTQGKPVRACTKAGTQASLDVRNLPAGLYLLELADKNGPVGVKRVVVQR